MCERAAMAVGRGGKSDIICTPKVFQKSAWAKGHPSFSIDYLGFGDLYKFCLSGH